MAAEQVGEVDTGPLGPDEQRPVGRVAQHAPGVAVAVELRLVGQRTGHQQPPQRAVPTTVAGLDGHAPRRGIADALELRLVTPGGPGATQHHLVAGQRAGLVGAHHRRGAQRLHRGQLPHHRAPPRHALHADRERDGDDRGQPLGDRGDRQCDRGQGGVGERVAAQQCHGEQHDRDHADHPGDRRPEPGDAPGQRGLRRLDTAQQAGDATELGAITGGHDDGLGAARGDEGAAVQQRPALGELRGGVDRLGGLVHRHGLPGQRRLVRAQPARVQDSQVGHHPRPRLERHHVARHEGLRHDLRPPPVAAHGRRLGHQLRQRLDRRAGPVLLHEPITALSTTTASTTAASGTSPSANATAADASRA